MGTGVPFVFKNIPADHSHKKAPIIRNGAAIAMLRGMEINTGNPKNRSIIKEVYISSNTMQKKIKPTSGVRIIRTLFVPVAILYMRFIICSRIDFIFAPLEMYPIGLPYGIGSVLAASFNAVLMPSFCKGGLGRIL